MKQPLPYYHPVWIVLGKIVLWVVFHTYLPARVRGRASIPSSGPFIIIANHVSYLDPVVVAWVVQRRLVHFMGKQELFKSRFLRFLLTRFGVFPVDRERLDRPAIMTALALLREGQPIGLFPEGTRSSSGELQQMRSGAVRFAIKMRCPLLPIGVRGTEKSYPRGAKFPKPARLGVRIGQPFELTEFYDVEMTAERTEQAVALMRAKIAALISGEA